MYVLLSTYYTYMYVRIRICMYVLTFYVPTHVTPATRLVIT